MDGMDGLAFCERVVANRPDLPVVMITAFGSLESAVAALRVGAYDFITKPFDVELLQHTPNRAVQHHALREEVKHLRQAVGAKQSFESMTLASRAHDDNATFGPFLRFGHFVPSPRS